MEIQSIPNLHRVITTRHIQTSRRTIAPIRTFQPNPSLPLPQKSILRYRTQNNRRAISRRIRLEIHPPSTVSQRYHIGTRNTHIRIRRMNVNPYPIFFAPVQPILRNRTENIANSLLNRTPRADTSIINTKSPITKPYNIRCENLFRIQRTVQVNRNLTILNPHQPRIIFDIMNRPDPCKIKTHRDHPFKKKRLPFAVSCMMYKRCPNAGQEQMQKSAICTDFLKYLLDFHTKLAILLKTKHGTIASR